MDEADQTDRIARHPEVTTTVGECLRRARKAQLEFAGWSQSDVDDVVSGVAWAGYQIDHADALARQAVADTGMGRVEDKIDKIRRKTLGTLQDLQGSPSVGIVEHDPTTGITEYAKPVGVVAALIPSTNPEATPINKTMMILKGRNAVVLAPSPAGAATCGLAVQYIHAELAKVGAPLDLVQYLPEPSKALSQELMSQCDLSVVTGSRKNVKAAYSSGKPAIGVGLGNATVVIEATADLKDAAEKIKQSKVFDYATSCSSENSLVMEETIYEAMLEELREVGGCLLTAEESARLANVMWSNGDLNREIIAQSPRRIAEVAGIDTDAARAAEFFLVEEDGVGSTHPFSGEKLSVVLTLYRYTDFDDAISITRSILDYQGRGHSCGIHTADRQKALRLADEIDVARVLVNQAHAHGNGGSFQNGLDFTLTMGCGTWGGNSISENLTYRHFLNKTRLVMPIEGSAPSEEQMWGTYFERHGR